MRIDPVNPNNEHLKKKWDDSKCRRADSLLITNIYDEEWGSHLDKELKQRFSSKEVLRDLSIVAETTLNPLRWLSEKTGAIYSKSPKRFINGEEIPEDSPAMAKGRINAMLDESCQLLQAHRDMFLRVIVDDDGMPDIDIILPEQVIVQTSSPSNLEWIVYSYMGLDGETEYQFWSDASHGTLDKEFNWIGEVDRNPYEIIPIVVAHSRFPVRRFWQGHQANGLVRTTLEAGIAMTCLRYLQKMQSFKILNLPSYPDDNFVLDVANPIVTPNGAATVLDWQADLQSFLDMILSHISTVLNFMGVRPEAVRGTLDASSGYALSIKMYDLQVVWDKLRRMWQMHENDLWRIVRRVYLVDKGENILRDGDLTIDYADIGPADDPKEKAELGKVYKDIGMSQRHMWEHLGYSEDWIDENFEQRQDEQLRFRQINIPEFDGEVEIG